MLAQGSGKKPVSPRWRQTIWSGLVPTGMKTPATPLSGGVAVRSLRTGDVPEKKAPLRAGLDSVLRVTGEEGLASPREEQLVTPDARPIRV